MIRKIAPRTSIRQTEPANRIQASDAQTLTSTILVSICTTSPRITMSQYFWSACRPTWEQTVSCRVWKKIPLSQKMQRNNSFIQIIEKEGVILRFNKTTYNCAKLRLKVVRFKNMNFTELMSWWACWMTILEKNSADGCWVAAKIYICDFFIN